MQKHEQINSPRNVCTTKTKIVDLIKNDLNASESCCFNLLRDFATLGLKNNDGNKLNRESRCANFACIITGIILY